MEEFCVDRFIEKAHEFWGPELMRTIPIFFFVLTIVLARESRAADARHLPAWAKGALWYRIVPERFRDGDPNNEPSRDSLELPIRPSPQWRPTSWTADWYARAVWEEELGPSFYADGVLDRRYGGDLQGLMDRLAYLQELGVNAIQLTPVFYSRSLHKTDPVCFQHIDPHFGPDPKGDLAIIEKEPVDSENWEWTAADKLFLELLANAHKRGIKVVLEAPFNSVGPEFFALKDFRKNQQKSTYKDWGFENPVKNGTNNWRGVPQPLAASEDTKDLAAGPKAYVFASTRRWMDPNADGDPSDGVDGWSIDGVEQRSPAFWKNWNALVRQINPQALTIAEVQGNPADVLQQGGFTTYTNHLRFTIPVKGFLIDGMLSASKFSDALEEHQKSTSVAAQNLIDSQDTDRLASMIVNSGTVPYKSAAEVIYNRNADARVSPLYSIRKPNERERKIQRLVALFQVAYPGAPTLYYGTEAGMWGGHDPDSRIPMVWADFRYDLQTIDPRGKWREPDDPNFDLVLFRFYKQVLGLRSKYPSLRTGGCNLLLADDEKKSVVFSRKTESESVLAAFNRSDSMQKLRITGSGLRKPALLFVTQGDPALVEATFSGRELELKIPPLTGALFGERP